MAITLPPGQWRVDVVVMALYQMALFFSAQLIFVNFLEYMPRTMCDENKFCYKLDDKCKSHYDKNADNICRNDTARFESCVEESNYVYFESAQWQYQQDCTDLAYFSATTTMYTGVLLANLVTGILADHLGRRPIFFISITIGVVSLVLSAALPGVKWYYIFRFTTGVGVAGSQIVGWSYGSELISAKRRFQLRTFSNWANARILIALVAFCTQEWHWATYVCAVLIASTIFPLLYYLPESPVFLTQKQKYDKARESKMRLAQICDQEYVESERKEGKKPLKKIKFMDIFKIPRLKTNFLILIFMWFYVGMATYITDLNGGDMSKNLYVGQFLSGLLLTVSKILFGLAEPRLPWLGRRMVFLFSQGVAIVAYVLILVALYTHNKETTWYTIVYLCAYSFQALSTETLYLSVAELIPTDIRVTVAAFCNIALRVGTIVASSTKPLKYIYEPSLFWINLIVCCFGISMVYKYLEESRNADLQKVGQDLTTEKEGDGSADNEVEKQSVKSPTATSAEKTEKSKTEKSEKSKKSKSEKSEKEKSEVEGSVKESQKESVKESTKESAKESQSQKET